MGSLADERFLDDLNPVQREAVTYQGGPLLVIAGAGSGKTRVLTYRIAYLIRRCGVRPWNILALTFTNKAADEMRERVEGLVGTPAREMMMGTFHSACARILRREIEPLGYSKRFSIYDELDSAQLIAGCLDEMGLDRKVYHPRAIRSIISRAKNEMIDEEAFARRATDFNDAVASEVYRLYQERMRENDALDFDDLLLVTVSLFDLYPGVLQEYRERFRHVLVDEYQDTNIAQYTLVSQLAAEHRNLCVVGDDDQGIYSWRGADIRNILEFEKDYPDARVVKLEQNYRSTQTIISAAASVISNNEGRQWKSLWTENPLGEKVRVYPAPDERAEAAFVCAMVEEAVSQGKRYDQVAVFYRTHAQSRVLEEALIRSGIPYRIFGGVRFYERAEIKDVVAYLRVIANPRDDVSLLRIMNVPSRGIGRTTVSALVEYARSTGLSLMGALREAESVPGLAPRAKTRISRFVSLMDGLVEFAASHEVDRLLIEVWERTGYMADLEAQRTLESESRIENLRELLGVVSDFKADYGSITLDDFLQRVSLSGDTDNLDTGAGYVSLMTLHNAKGLEFPGVFMVGREEGVIPPARSMDNVEARAEERRL